MKAMMEELVGSAPKFFAKNMVAASEQEIAKVEAAAGSILSDGHRTLLRYLGGTEPQQLSVFLCGRDLSVANILQCYKDFKPFPPELVLLSYVPEELVVLKHGKSVAEDPLLGGFGWVYNEFYSFEPDREQHLDDWILRWLINFRIAQPEFCVSWNGPKNVPDWSEPYKATVAVLTQMGFQAVATHPISTFLSRGLECAEIFSDGSAFMASDSADEIDRIMSVLNDYIYIDGFHFESAKDRMRAPRE